MDVNAGVQCIRRMGNRVKAESADDVAPQLLEAIRNSFEALYREDRQIAEILARMDEGTVTHLVTQDYAVRVGELVSEAMRRNLSSGVLPDGKMYYNIAERTIRPAMQTGHDLVNDIAVRVDRELRRRANISIKPIRPSMSDKRIKAIEDKACSAEWFDDVAYVLDEPVKNTVQSFADTFMEENVEGLMKFGLRPKVTRRVVGSCCDWCAEKAGTYIRGEEPEGFYRRHDYCRCTVTYDPGTGKVQDAHSKKWYNSPGELIEASIAEREDLLLQLKRHPARLGSYTPARLKKELEEAGYEVMPLGRGFHAGRRFEDGGGFRVNFAEDGGYFQYHPKEGSHHGGEYYKFCSGKGGQIRYDKDGNENEDPAPEGD